jgi:hypothetical protein
MTGKGPRHARRTDDNHSEIRDALRDVPGVYCHDVSAVAGLGFDLLCNFRGGAPVFLEVKQPATRNDLTKSERKARDHWGDAWHVVTSLEEALRALGAT